MTEENLRRVVLESPTNGPAVVEELLRLKNITRAVYFNGVREGLRKYAWWKEGIEYVGSCGTTLKAALANIDAEENDG